MMRRVLLVLALFLGDEAGAAARPPDRADLDQRISIAGRRARPASVGQDASPEPRHGAEPSASSGARTAPWLLGDVELAHLARTDLAALGSLSLGRPNAGALIGGVQMPAGEGWEVVDPKRSWGTQETIAYLVSALGELRRRIPDAPRVFVGDLSREHGGALGPHRSHQSGRDVDLGYLHKPGMHVWYQHASARTLDVAKTWALVRALVTETDVEAIFMDLGVQKLLKEHALGQGEDRAWLDSLFRFGSVHPAPLIRQAWGHSSHMHVRFFNPHAEGLALRCYRALVDSGIIAPRQRIVRYVARAGDTVTNLAARAGSSRTTIAQLNKVAGELLEPGRTYLVPLRGRVAELREVHFEPRRLPPAGGAPAPLPV